MNMTKNQHKNVLQIYTNTTPKISLTHTHTHSPHSRGEIIHIGSDSLKEATKASRVANHADTRTYCICNSQWCDRGFMCTTHCVVWAVVEVHTMGSLWVGNN